VGDVLLQKTFIEDVLTGVSKKNTGQLPQYYIENNHEGIVTKQMFRDVLFLAAFEAGLSSFLLLSFDGEYRQVVQQLHR